MSYIVSHSDAEQHSRCEWAHHYSYGFNLVPKKMPEHLQRGDMGHKVLAGYYRAVRDGYNWDDACEAGRAAWRECLKTGKYDFEIADEVLKIFEAYVEYYHPNEWEIIWVEEYIEYQVTDNFVLNGEIDLVIRDKRRGKFFGKLGIVDHKWSFNFMTAKEVETHSQIPKYMFACNQMDLFGEEIQFGLINELRWRSVKNVSDMFAREPLEPSEIKQAAFIAEYIKQCNRIVPKRNLEDPVYWKEHSGRTTIKDICRSCDFVTPCVEELNGKSPDTTLKVYFTQKDHSYREQRTRVNGKPIRSEGNDSQDS